MAAKFVKKMVYSENKLQQIIFQQNILIWSLQNNILKFLRNPCTGKLP